MSSVRPRRLRALPVAVCAALTVLTALLATSFAVPAGAASPRAKTTPYTLPAKFPTGVTLRVGDQLDYLKNLLATSGQDKDFPYTVQYANFVGGPLMLQAFQAGELDGGFVADAPLIFAQAAKQDVVGVAGWEVGRSIYSLVTAPGVAGIKGWKGLKGKRVAIQEGTVVQSALLLGLTSAGLEQSDVTIVNVPTTQIAQVLKGGQADAGILPVPLSTVYLRENPTAKTVVDADDLTNRVQFFVSNSKALSDTGKTAAVADYISRLQKAFAWVAANPEPWARKVYVEQYGLPLEVGLEYVKGGGGTTFLQLPGPLGGKDGPQQRLSDLFFENGIIPIRLKAASQFDTRFNSLIAANAKADAK